MIRHLIWDWNGTLLDDVAACVDTLNTLLHERSLPAVDADAYRRGFGFPVRDYYVGLGFDFSREEYSVLSETFISRYKSRLPGVTLHREALSVLQDMAGKVTRQMVVSAMEHTMLGEMLDAYGVRPHMADFHGIGDLGASSKIEVGVKAVRALGVPPQEVLLIGDTAHDDELAQAIGCACVLFARGHQEASRLQKTGRPIIEDLGEIIVHLQSA